MWKRAGFLGLYILKANLPLNGQAATTTVYYWPYFIQWIFWVGLCIIIYVQFTRICSNWGRVRKWPKKGVLQDVLCLQYLLIVDFHTKPMTMT